MEYVITGGRLPAESDVDTWNGQRCSTVLLIVTLRLRISRPRSPIIAMTEITRIVADADVLAADLLVGGAARDSLDVVRAHSWIELVASDVLLADAEAVIATLADDELATDWREMIETERVAVDHPPEDHPALASAYQSEAAHVLSFDERLQSAKAGVTLREHMDVSIKHPDAFVHLFDAERLYEAVFDEPYPGPDRDPRA